MVLIGSRATQRPVNAQYTIITFNTGNEDQIEPNYLASARSPFPVWGEHWSRTSSSALVCFSSGHIRAYCCGTVAFVAVFRGFFYFFLTCTPLQNQTCGVHAPHDGAADPSFYQPSVLLCRCGSHVCGFSLSYHRALVQICIALLIFLFK